jgi:hypothetical protein
MMVSALRLPSRSESQPEKSLEIEAVASPIPSIRPTISALAPSTEVRKTGSRPWIISEEMSMNRLTQPSAHTPRGMARSPVFFCSVIPISMQKHNKARPRPHEWPMPGLWITPFMA